MKESWDFTDEVLGTIQGDEVIELVKKLVQIPSVSGEETEIAKFLAGFMREKGFQVELQEVEVGGRQRRVIEIRRTGRKRKGWKIVNPAGEVLVVPVIGHRGGIRPPLAVFGRNVQVAIVLQGVVDQLPAAG